MAVKPASRKGPADARPWRPVLVGLSLIGLAAIVLALVARRGGRHPEPVVMVQLPASGRAVLVGRSPRGSTPWCFRLTGEDGRTVAETTVAVAADGRLEAAFHGLAAGTRYRFTVHRADQMRGPAFVEGAFLTTGPHERPAPNPCRLLVFGDSGSGDVNQFDLAEGMRRVDPDLILHTGDLVYREGRYEWYDAKFFQPYARLLNRAPFFPCPGNHDADYDEGRPYYRTFILPENGPPGAAPEQHYWFDFAGMRIISLDSNQPYEHLRDVVVPWLDRVLAEAPGPWKIMLFHHPPYTNGKYAPSGKCRDLLVPLFDRHRVGLVLNGHNHMYERTHPMRGGQVVPDGEGTTYIVSGAGGGELYEIGPANPPWMCRQMAGRFSFTVIDVHPDRMELQQIGSRGEVLDTARISCPLRPAGPAPAPESGS